MVLRFLGKKVLIPYFRFDTISKITCILICELSGAKRNRVYYARDILNILEEPAKLTPDQAPNI